MSHHDPIEADRLYLREVRLVDAPVVRLLAGEWEVAKTTTNIPHPYEDGMAEKWIKRQHDLVERGDLVSFAVILKIENALIGAVSMIINKRNHWGELGYWIGKPYWNKGYCTEAAGAIVDHGFRELGLNRIQARHMTHNPASGRVMQKFGMAYEGTHRQAAFRSGSFNDVAMYAILRDDLGRDKNGRNMGREAHRPGTAIRSRCVFGLP